MSRTPVSMSRMLSVRIFRSFLSMAPWLFPSLGLSFWHAEFVAAGETFSPLLELLSQGQDRPCLKGVHGGGLLPDDLSHLLRAQAYEESQDHYLALVRGQLGQRIAEVEPIDHHRRIAFAAYSFDEILTGGLHVVPARQAYELPDDPSRQIEALFEALPAGI